MGCRVRALVPDALFLECLVPGLPRHLGISGGAAWSVVYEDFLRQLPTEAGIKYLRAVLSLERVIAEAPAHAHGWFYLPDWPAPGKATT